MTTMLDSALALAERGAAVLPCRPRAKEPATAHGLKDATTDPTIIRQWWQAEPAYNIGLATGAVSGLFVIDVDGLDGESEMRKLEAEHGALPETVEVITGRGRHIYFKMPDMPVRNSASKLAPSVDVRGDGGYVLAPPSIHPSGRRYHWSVDCANKIAPAPEWLLARLCKPKNSTTATPPAAWRDLAAAGAAEGCRDMTVTKLAGHLLYRHIDPIVTLTLLLSWNATHCAPPLPESDINRIVASICGRELKRCGDAG